MYAAHFLRHLLLGLLLAALLPLMAVAAVPHESAVPAYAEEQTMLQREQGLPEPGFGSAASGRNHFDRHFIIPPGFMPEQDMILQRGGNTWRNLRNGPMASIAGTLLLVVPLLIFGFYHTVGPMVHDPDSGRKIQRFTVWERVIHWATAFSFIALALTGLLIMFGKQILLPWMGHTVFYWFAIISKYIHNFVGPLFILCSILMFATFVRRNFFRRWDWQWIKKGGGLVKHEHIPSGFFNAGEKLWFWGGVTVLGLLVSITGLMLNFPYIKNIGGPNFGLTRYLLQVADYLHIIGATLYIVASMGHIYIGTLGTQGAYRAMRNGDVDEEWARSHHEIWYNEVKGGQGADSRAPGTSHPLPPGTSPHPRA